MNTFLYINSKNYKQNMNNSVYDLSFFNKSLFIPDYRNNKVLEYSISSKTYLNSFDVHSPHGISIDTKGSVYLLILQKMAQFEV